MLKVIQEELTIKIIRKTEKYFICFSRTDTKENVNAKNKIKIEKIILQEREPIKQT